MRFHKYFRISRERFDEIYKAAALSGLFGLHPPEPMYSEVHPEDPGRPGHHQDDKKIPLCLMIGAVMRRVASGNTFASLGEEFHIGGSTLHSFDSKFWNWFRNFNAVQDRKEYWSTWVGGVSGVGFDDIASIQHEEKLFRQMGLPGFITCMDDVHFAGERAPYQIRCQYVGKEGYPSIVVNLHCTATGWIKYPTTVFAPLTTKPLCAATNSSGGCEQILSSSTACGTQQPWTAREPPMCSTAVWHFAMVGTTTGWRQ